VSDNGTRRDFLYVATTAVGAVGAAAAAWPFIDYLNPDAAERALASIEVNIADLQEGQSITVMWRGKPIFIRYRTPQEIADAEAVAMSDLKDPFAQNANLSPEDPSTDPNRSVPGEQQYIIMIANCTHFGCIPTGESGEYGGWYCPCHGSQFDTAGRVRAGPAARNLDIPPYKKDGDVIVIG